MSLVLSGLGAGPAAAHGGEPEVLLDRTTGEPGDSVAIQVSGLAPGTEVELRLVGVADGAALPLGAGTVPASSDLDVVATIPANVAPGAYVVEAKGAGLVLTADLTIVARAGGQPGGGQAPLVTWIAVALLLAGALVVAAAAAVRRMRR